MARISHVYLGNKKTLEGDFMKLLSVTFRFLHKSLLVAEKCFLLVVFLFFVTAKPHPQLTAGERMPIGRVIFRVAGNKSNERFYKIDRQDFWDSIFRRSSCLVKSITAENLNTEDGQTLALNDVISARCRLLF